MRKRPRIKSVRGTAHMLKNGRIFERRNGNATWLGLGVRYYFIRVWFMLNVNFKGLKKTGVDGFDLITVTSSSPCE